MRFGETPTVPQRRSPSVLSMSTRVVAPVASFGSRMRPRKSVRPPFAISG